MNVLNDSPRGRRAGRDTWRRIAVPAALAALVMGACDDTITEPRDDTDDVPSQAAPYTVILAWNELARDLVTVHGTTPPVAARAYALLGIAQHDALIRVRESIAGAALGGNAALSATSSAAATEAELDAAAVTVASMEVLAYLYPVEANVLAQRAVLARPDVARSEGASDDAVSAAIAAGKAAAEAVIAHARTDGAADAAVWDGEIPEGPGMWFSSADPPMAPLLPRWGNVTPWLMESGDQFRPPAPPATDSPEFADALAEVRRFSDERTQEQQRIAEYWADGPGTFTPPGHWNEIAAELIEKHELDALEAARALAYMNMAVMDAGISCWDAKYTYWLLRPTQVDSQITLAVELPNFPAYTSGHSSFSGAAAEVLAHFFPAERDALAAMADEAAISRVYGGIHYRFDSDRALEQGRAIAELAIAKAEADAALAMRGSTGASLLAGLAGW